MTTRRNFLTITGTFALGMALTACATQPQTSGSSISNPAATATSGTLLIPANILQIVTTVVSESAALVDIINQAKPNTVTPEQLATFTKLSTEATTLLNSLNSNVPVATGAVTIQTIFTDVNTISADIGPMLPELVKAYPKLSTAVDTYEIIAPLLPLIENWLSTIITQTTPPKK